MSKPCPTSNMGAARRDSIHLTKALKKPPLLAISKPSEQSPWTKKLDCSNHVVSKRFPTSIMDTTRFHYSKYPSAKDTYLHEPCRVSKTIFTILMGGALRFR